MPKMPDLSAVFAKYERLQAEADLLFEKVREQHPDCVTCQPGCSDCCNALFDLPLIEAMYLNKAFTESVPHGRQRSDILLAADQADRRAYKIKREIFKESQQGEDSNKLLEDAARLRLRCPLLDAESRCVLYDRRPVTCRIYGIPTSIGCKAHSCGLAAFKKGQAYPTVDLDRLNNRLMTLSQELAQNLQTRYSELPQVFVPVSMALITSYDEEYLGLTEKKPEE